MLITPFVVFSVRKKISFVRKKALILSVLAIKELVECSEATPTDKNRGIISVDVNKANISAWPRQRSHSYG